MCDSTGGPDRRPPRWPPPIDTRATNAAESAGSLSLTVCANHQGTRLAGCAAGLKNAPWGECTETGLQGASALNALNAMQEAALRGTLFQHVSNTCTRCCAKEMCTLSRDTRPTLCADCGPGGSPKSTPLDAMRCRYNTPPFAALSPAGPRRLSPRFCCSCLPVEFEWCGYMAAGCPIGDPFFPIV